MKRNIAVLVSILLGLSILVFFTGCPQSTQSAPSSSSNSGGGGSGGGSGSEVDAVIQAQYEQIITALAQTAQLTAVPEMQVSTIVAGYNVTLAEYGYKLTDSQNGAEIPQGTTAEQLKQRFKIVKK